MDSKESENVKVSDLWMEFIRNKPLRIVAFFFITAFAMMSVSNAADAYFMSYNVEATPLLTTLFMCVLRGQAASAHLRHRPPHGDISPLQARS